MPKIRVAHVCSVDLALRYLLVDQLCYLKEVGYDVVGISGAGPNIAYVESRGIPHIEVPFVRAFTPLEDLRSLAQITRVLARERFAIVHTHNPKPGLLGQLAATATRTPVVVNTVHGFYFHDDMDPKWRRFYIGMEKVAALQSDAILSQNPEDVRTAVAEGICKPEKIELLGNGIDLARFDPTRIGHAQKLALRTALGITPEDRVVGFIGRLVAEKGLPELFEAFRHVLALVPNAKLLVIGPKDEVKSDALSEEDAHRHGIAERTVFTGMRQDIPELLSIMDVFVLPSHREGFPRAPMEAAAMRVPTIVTDIRGCRETVVHEQTGLITPVRDHAGLARAILRMLEDEAAARSMGVAARALAEKKFDQRAVFAKVAETYGRLLRARGLVAP